MEESGIGKVVKGVDQKYMSRGREGLAVLVWKGLGTKGKCNTPVPRVGKKKKKI